MTGTGQGVAGSTGYLWKEEYREFGKAVRGYVTQRNFGRLSFPSREGYVARVGDHGLVVAIDEDGQLAEGGEGASAPLATVAERKAASLATFSSKCFGST